MIRPETTDITLFVRTSNDDVARWDRQRIVDSLIQETNIDNDTAEAVSKEVEKQIISSGISLLTTSLVREMVDAKLIERGLEQSRRMHARIGFPLYDVGQLILHQNKENANIPHGPEGTSLLLSEGIKREYAFYDVFSQDVVEAHIAGDIHLHSLGYIDRPYSSFHSLEYIKKFGLHISNSMTIAKPAKHPEVLLAHMVRFGAALQGHFAGVLAWDAVNLLFAPYLKKMSERQVKQFAQMLIFEFSQLTAARGGQAIFTDIHLYWEVPKHYEDVPAIGPGGDYTGKTYKDYLIEAQKLVWAIFDVYKEGDAFGKPFIFPRPLVHITKEFFNTPGHKDFLNHICDVAIGKGNTCFVFDRDRPKIFTDGCFNLEDEKELQDILNSPWKMRCAAIQNVTLNLPRLGYKAGKNRDRLFALVNEHLELSAKAHIQKKSFMEKLLSHGENGPLSMLSMNLDDQPYLRMKHATYLMGIMGLNELVQICLGNQMHESTKAVEFGLNVVKHIKTEADILSKKYGMRFLLEQSPAETTAYRFARLDLKYFSPEAGYFIRGDIRKGEVYYTNSTHLNVSANLPPMERVKIEGRFHPFFNAGAATHIWLGEAHISKISLAGFTRQVFKDTYSNQIIFSPEFTACAACCEISKGLKEACSFCGSKEVDGIARITRYFSKTSGWNKGKLAELRDRNRIGELS